MYNVCNKFNIWPQRKDKFIKFPSAFKGLKRRTQEKRSCLKNQEKMLYYPQKVHTSNI